ncbi:MAG: UDP-N-acetylglucosamine--N-acetylmuramyl-(pentapeptide) pyrophosphoryl-undecaprenol N-acetylglucosamine transferase [Bacteriovoracaceae bacterium]
MPKTVSKASIVFTGGGSGGHVVPAKTLIQSILRTSDIPVSYIGSIDGVEKEVISKLSIDYHSIQTGKLRRYFSFENMLDFFKVAIGCLQAFLKLLSIRPRVKVIFSTGGFVVVPVVIAAWVLGKKIIIHEQTTRVGLANKICSYFADMIIVSYEYSMKFFPNEKTIFLGYPLRDELFDSKLKTTQLEKIEFNDSKNPLLFITGGGNGSKLLNDFVKRNLEVLKENFQIIHQVGKNHLAEFQNLSSERYLPLSFIGEEYIDIIKSAKVIVSRAGAGTVSELIAINKKSIFIPLKIAQKNEQFHNAMEANSKLGSLVIEEDDFDDEKVLRDILNFIPSSLERDNMENPKEKIIEAIQKFL